MSRYIDMIIAENRTLTKKIEGLHLENSKLKNELEMIMVDYHRLLRDNQILTNQLCSNRHVCQSLNPHIRGVIGVLGRL